MTTRRVLHITDSSAMGGAEQQILTTMRLLDRTVWEPVLVHPGHQGSAPLVDAVRAAGMSDRLMPHMPDGLSGAVQVPPFARTLRAERAAVAHVHLTWPLAMKWPLVAALAARVPAVVASVHAAIPCPTDRSVLWQQRQLATRVNRYIAVSDSVAERCTAWFGWPAERFSVIPNGIPVEAFGGGARARGRALAGVPLDVPMVLTLARLDPLKGLDTLVAAAAQVPDVRFVIGGEGAERATLSAQIAAASLGDRVLLPGHLPETADLLAAADLMVLPSRSEGLPLALLEAMAAGVPVIASDIPGVTALVSHDQTGVLVPVDDPGALADAVSGLLADEERRRRLADTARTHVQTHHSAEQMVHAIGQLYTGILEREQP